MVAVPPSLSFTDGSHLFFVVFRKMVSFVSDSTVGTKKTGMAAAFDDERTNRQANFFKEKRNSQELSRRITLLSFLNCAAQNGILEFNKTHRIV